MVNIKKRKIFKDIYELDIKFSKRKNTKIYKENFIFNGKSVSAICFNKDLKVFYFIKQMRPNYFFHKFNNYPLEIVAGGINKNETSKKAIIREIKEELGINAISVKKIDTLIIAPDCLEEITDLYFAEVTIIHNFEIINPAEGEFIKIIKLNKKEIKELLNKKRPQNIVTKIAFLKILETKI